MKTKIRKELYGKKIPSWLRAIKCFAIQDKTYRFGWGEFTPCWGFALSYGVYHEEAHIHIHLIWGSLFIKVPMIINQRPGTEDWNAHYGFSIFDSSIHFNWRTKCKILYLPWSWEFYKRWELVEGWSNKKHWIEIPREMPHGKIAFTETNDYLYVLKSGEKQHRKATFYINRMEWRMRGLYLLPWPRKVRESIWVDFDGEVGEETGSWKGGTTGCGYELKPGETGLQCLRRMEKERKF